MTDQSGRRRAADSLPDFPWDVLAPFGDRARTHPDGLVDLSVGTPVDPTPASAQEALRAAANSPGYPTVAGRLELRDACARWLVRSQGVAVPPGAIVPTIGSKEMVAALPRQLGIPAGATIVIPEVAYPTYAVGALLAGCRFVATDEPETVPDAAMIWINTPGNPTGAVLAPERAAAIVEWARERGIIVASDECYIELGWDVEPVSVLHPTIAGANHGGLIALHSLSKRSNFAGYRFGFAAGDQGLISELLAVRKHSGMMVPSPVQAAAIAALDDDEHAREQRERYGRRRGIVKAALEGAGFRIDHSEAGLYLWATRGEPCWETVSWFADRGILVTPGDFYGPAGERHIRVAMTATDDHIDAFAMRLASA